MCIGFPMGIVWAWSSWLGIGFIDLELMVRTQRRALHQAIAEWYEQHHEAQLPRFYPLLAYHWSRTDETAKAVQFQGLAGQPHAGQNP